jgi:peroxiredoxin
MDKIEQLYKTHRSALDQLEASPAMWGKVEQQLLAKAPQKRGWAFAAMVLSALLALSVWSFPSDASESLGYDDISPDISMQDPEGVTRSLSDLKGKVVLVEFWASWCGVCSKKNCEDLLPLYDTYKERGFEIFAVSVDEDHNQWLDGIQTYRLPWIHVSDLQGFASPVSQRFDVSKTPTTYLLDENQRIIGKNLTRQELANKLHSCYLQED